MNCLLAFGAAGCRGNGVLCCQSSAAGCFAHRIRCLPRHGASTPRRVAPRPHRFGGGPRSAMTRWDPSSCA